MKLCFFSINVHAGNKYLRYLRNRYFDNPEIDPLNHMILIYILAKNRLDDTIGIRYLNTDNKLADKLVHWIDGTAGYGYSFEGSMQQVVSPYPIL